MEARRLRQPPDPEIRPVVCGRYAAVLGGLDNLVFIAGIGENSAEVREALCRKLAGLGVALDEAANAGGGPRIYTPDARSLSGSPPPKN
jgi:acetate kinase